MKLSTDIRDVCEWALLQRFSWSKVNKKVGKKSKQMTGNCLQSTGDYRLKVNYDIEASNQLVRNGIKAAEAYLSTAWC